MTCFFQIGNAIIITIEVEVVGDPITVAIHAIFYAEIENSKPTIGAIITRKCPRRPQNKFYR